MVEFNYKRDDTVRFTFGKYRSRPVSEVAEEDPQYLRWVILNMASLDATILKEIYDCLEDEGSFDVDDLKDERECLFGAGRRKQSSKFRWDSEFKEEVKETVYSTRSTSEKTCVKSSVDNAVLKAYRESAKKWHPDLCKGSSEPMKAINDFYEKLKESLSRL